MTAAEGGGAAVTGPGAGEPSPALPILAQLAASLLESAAGLDAGRAARLGRLEADPRFAGPLARAARAGAPLAVLPLDAGFASRLRDVAASRLCALLVCRPSGEVDRAALLVAAAVRQRDIAAAVLKADRERLRGALGEDALDGVSREALLLHGPLVELGSDPAVRGPGDASDPRGSFLSTGRRVFGRFIALVEPALSGPGEARWPEARPSALPGMTERHCDHVVRLVRRRMPSWPMLTA